MPVTSEQIIMLVVLAVGMLFVVYFELKVLRGKSKELRRATLAKDEAYNAILTTRSVIIAMQRQGARTEKAQRLVDEAKLALERSDHETAKELCRSARHELTGPGKREAPKKIRALRTASSSEDEPEEDRLMKVAGEILSSDRAGKTPEAYSGTKLHTDQEGNYLSAKFEIHTARADIKNADDRGDDTSTANRLLTDAENAFAAGSYTKALSLAVRSRRSVNEVAEEEAIKLRREPTNEQVKKRGTDEAAAGESEAPPSECESCGAPLDADDAFCHRCGKKVETEKECAGCGATTKAGDAFCRKCGSRVD